ncbi:hypothetical protein D910_03074 [Dendroctonus ponderosae]|uniref:Uncharacterized protein n=1 Tax=Dendroctonus ponderosae TaxID=77166 RepID=U4TXW6_DENPD|nr:hypothetical protein D910_03074 [Dendroctonus ponderosae]
MPRGFVRRNDLSLCDSRRGFGYRKA